MNSETTSKESFSRAGTSDLCFKRRGQLFVILDPGCPTYAHKYITNYNNQ